MGVAECCHPEASAPPAVEQASCVVCSEAALQRCEECFDEAEGHLYLCAKDACFDATHNVRNSSKHRKSLAAWNSKAKWTDKCCEAHKGNLLALWCSTCAVPVCTLCCSHGVHNGHATSLVIDAWKELQEQLRKTMGLLEDKNTASRERLRRLTEEQEELRSGKGAVGEARRVLHEVKAEFLAKVEALDAELDETAVKWCRLAAEEHEQLARYTRGVQSVVDDMRATCAEEDAEEAQRVAIAHSELRVRLDVLGRPPPVSVREVGFEAAPLCEAVTRLCLHEAARVEAYLCTACGASLIPGHSPLCAACAEAVCAFEEQVGDLQSASLSMRANKAVALAAVAIDGHQLAFLDVTRLIADKDVVMTAVAQSGTALQYASDLLQADKDVVMAAVEQDGYALQFASEALKEDEDVRQMAGR